MAIENIVTFEIVVFLRIIFIIILCEWVFCLHVYVCTMYIPGVCRGQKGALDPLWLDTVINHHVHAGITPRFSGGAASAFHH